MMTNQILYDLTEYNINDIKSIKISSFINYIRKLITN